MSKEWYYVLSSAFICWLYVYGLTGLFFRYFSQQSDRMRYISDASYWVYLIHLPFTLFLPGLFVDLPVSAGVKFTLMVVVTSFICFSTYHYFVRSTFIGKFLNGRKYPRKAAE